jgi:hypothetical protein
VRADEGAVGVLRYPVSLALVLVALLATIGVFVFARPQYRPAEQHTVDMATRHHYTSADVQRVFAAHGLPLTYANHMGKGQSYLLTLSETPRPWATSQLYVYLAGPADKVSWGPADTTSWEQRSANLLIHYGGANTRMLAQVKAAASELRG